MNTGDAVASTVKLTELVAKPPGVVTAIGPDTAPVGTVAVIDVGASTVKLVAFTPPNDTAVAPEKFVPEIVTTVPTGPATGSKLEMVGGATVAGAVPADRSSR